MDCPDVRELLDAYALGAAEKREAQQLEEHVADCVRCWEELTQAQQSAALLAFSIALQEPPTSLERRILARAAQERDAALRGSTPLLRRLRISWPVAAGAFGLAGAAALAFTAFLQVQMSDLRDDRDNLMQQVAEARVRLDDQNQIFNVLFDPNQQTKMMPAVATGSSAWGEYHWSKTAGQGVLACHDMPPLAEGEVYQAWFVAQDGPIPAGTFESTDGDCWYPMEPARTPVGLTGVGITREKRGGSNTPGEWLLFASLRS